MFLVSPIGEFNQVRCDQILHLVRFYSRIFCFVLYYLFCHMIPWDAHTLSRGGVHSTMLACPTAPIILFLPRYCLPKPTRSTECVPLPHQKAAVSSSCYFHYQGTSYPHTLLLPHKYHIVEFKRSILVDHLNLRS